MSIDPDLLYNLLPRLYRLRDIDQGYPLRRMLRVIGDQHRELVEDTAIMYDDWFIETCRPELVPYFADLLGVQLDDGPHAAPVDPELDRARVADALSVSRGKGTVASVELLAADVGRFPARVIDAGQLVSTTQSVRFPDLPRHRVLDVRRHDPGQVLFTMFRRADVRRVDSPRTRGSGDRHSVLVYLWRLRPDTYPAATAAFVDLGRYTFDPLGRDLQLAVDPVDRAPAAAPVGDLDVPTPLTRAALIEHLADYYGPGRSVEVAIDDGTQIQPLPMGRVDVADLSEWRHSGHDRVTVDPVLGRIRLPERHGHDIGEPPRIRVRFTRLIVGGPGADHRARAITDEAGAARYRVSVSGEGHHRTIPAAITAWVADLAAGKGNPIATIEILDDHVYREPLAIDLFRGERLTIRAAPGVRPVLAPSEMEAPDWLAALFARFDDAPVPLFVRGQDAARPARRGNGGAGRAGPLPTLVLAGVYLSGQALVLDENLGKVTLEHCTLEPARRRRRAPSIVLRSTTAHVALASCISGPIAVAHERPPHERVAVTISDSILDCGAEEPPALFGAGRPADAVLTLVRSTVFGSIDVERVELVEDSLLTGRLECMHRQHGEVRFSYLDPVSSTPRRTHCQPEHAVDSLDPDAFGDLDAAAAAVIRRLQPVFHGENAHDAAYGRLADTTAPELRRGAHDGGELGAYHDLWQNQRVDALRRRLANVVPADIDIDIRFAT